MRRRRKKNYVQSKAIITIWTSGSGAQSLEPYCNPVKDGFILELDSLTPARKPQQRAAAEQALTSLLLS